MGQSAELIMAGDPTSANWIPRITSEARRQADVSDLSLRARCVPVRRARSGD
jgi:hypothetical protein